MRASRMRISLVEGRSIGEERTMGFPGIVEGEEVDLTESVVMWNTRAFEDMTLQNIEEGEAPEEDEVDLKADTTGSMARKVRANSMTS